MVVLTLRHVNVAPKGIFTIEVPDDSTISDLISLLSDRDHPDCESIRLVHLGLFLDSTTSVTTLQASDSAPINVFGKPRCPPSTADSLPPVFEKSSTPPDKSTASSEKSSSLPDKPISDHPFPAPESPPKTINPRIQAYVDMGFSEKDSLKAFELTQGNDELAIELLSSGDLSIENLTSIPLSGHGGVPKARLEDMPALWPIIFRDRSTVNSLLAGNSVDIAITVAGMLTTVVVTPEVAGQYAVSTFGCGLQQFIAGGGARAFPSGPVSPGFGFTPHPTAHRSNPAGYGGFGANPFGHAGGFGANPFGSGGFGRGRLDGHRGRFSGRLGQGGAGGAEAALLRLLGAALAADSLRGDPGLAEALSGTSRPVSEDELALAETIRQCNQAEILEIKQLYAEIGDFSVAVQFYILAEKNLEAARAMAHGA
jgi:hypothetical protein